VASHLYSYLVFDPFNCHPSAPATVATQTQIPVDRLLWIPSTIEHVVDFLVSIETNMASSSSSSSCSSNNKGKVRMEGWLLKKKSGDSKVSSFFKQDNQRWFRIQELGVSCWWW
jgi:hypothetical protein